MNIKKLIYILGQQHFYKVLKAMHAAKKSKLLAETELTK